MHINYYCMAVLTNAGLYFFHACKSPTRGITRGSPCKSAVLEGQRLFGPLKMGLSKARAHFGAQKVEVPSKTADLHGEPLVTAVVGDLHA